MLDSDRTRAPSPVTPQVKPVIIGGKRTKVPPPTSVEVDIDVDDERLNVFLNAEENESPEKDEEMQEPERKRRARGRPPKRERVVETSTPQEYQLTELTEQEAAALDYDTWLNKFPWETGQYTLKLRRQYPTQLQIGAKRVDIAGLIHEQNAPLYENEITEQFGGKTWQVVVVGPDPKTGKHRALSNKQLIVPGEPRLSAESLPHNMWIDVRPLLIEAGKLKEEDDDDSSMDDDIPASALNPHRMPFNSPYNMPYGMQHGHQQFQRPPREREVDKFSVDALNKAFRSATTMARDTATSALKEKERLFENQNRIFTDQEKRANEERSRIEREREVAVAKADEIRKQNEEEKRLHAQQLEDVKKEAEKRLEEERRRAQQENTQAVTTGLDLFKTIFPSQTANAQEAQNNLIRMFENRIASAESGHQNALQAERALAQANIVAMQSMYQGQLESAREQARMLQDQNKIATDRIETLRDQIQIILRQSSDQMQAMLQQKAIEASSSNRTSELIETMTMLNQLKETVGGNSTGTPEEPSLSTTGGMLARVMQTIENVAPSVAQAVAARSANAAVNMMPQMPVQETAMIPAPPMPEMPPIVMNPEIPPPAPQKQKPPAVKIKKEVIAEQLKRLSLVFNENTPPGEETIDSIARGINATQEVALLDVIAKSAEDKLIASFDRSGLIPEVLKSEKGLTFLIEIIRKVKFYRQSV